MHAIDETHSPALVSWLASANQPGTDFPLQNLPHGVFRRLGSAEAWRGGVAIGDQVLGLPAAHAAGLFTGEAAMAAEHAAAPALNGLMALPNLVSVLASIPILLKLKREFFSQQARSART